MTPEQRTEEIFNIILGVDHPKLPHAIFADLFDIIPIIGDVSNVARAAKETDETQRARQAVDLLVGVLPDPFGGVLDFLTPTNTIKYLIETQGWQV